MGTRASLGNRAPVSGEVSGMPSPRLGETKKVGGMPSPRLGETITVSGKLSLRLGDTASALANASRMSGRKTLDIPS